MGSIRIAPLLLVFALAGSALATIFGSIRGIIGSALM